MRSRLFLSFILTLMTVLSFAQGLESKKITEEGVTLLLRPIHITSKWQPTIDYILLFHKKIDGDKCYSLILRVETPKQGLAFQKGMMLLIKTSSGHVIQLKNASGDDGIDVYRSDGGLSYIKRDYYYGKDLYLYSILYTISEDEFGQLAAEGISSLRLQTSANDINCEYPLDKTQKLAAFFSSAMSTIEDALNPRLSF